MLQEQKLGASGLVETGGAAKIGELLGADILLEGSTTPDVQESYEDKETYYTDKKGVQHTVVVRYHIRRVVLRVTLRVLEVSGGGVLATFDREDSDSKTGTEYNNLPSADSMLKGRTDVLGAFLVSSLLPQNVGMSIELQKVKSRDDNVEDSCNKVAAKAAESGSLDEAWALYSAAKRKDPLNPNITFNIAVLHEAIGDYEPALKMFKAVHEMDVKNKDYAAAVHRVESEMATRAGCAAKGYVLPARTFNADDAQTAIAKAAAPKVRVSSSKAVLLDQPSATAKVVAPLPKNTVLEVMERKSDAKDTYFHVKVLAMEGWVSGKHVETQ